MKISLHTDFLLHFYRHCNFWPENSTCDEGDRISKRKIVTLELIKIRFGFFNFTLTAFTVKVYDGSSVFAIAFMFLLLNTDLLDKLKITICCSKQTVIGLFFSLQLAASEQQFLSSTAASFCGLKSYKNWSDTNGFAGMQNKRYRQGDTRGYGARHDDDGFDSLSDGGRPWKIPLAGSTFHTISTTIFCDH